MKRLLSAALCAMLALLPALGLATQVSFLDDYDAIERAMNSVLYLEVYEDSDNEYDATGSGFVAFNDGTFITNYHVIEGARRIVAFDEDYKEYAVGDVLAQDPEKDIAIIAFREPTGLLPLPLAQEYDLKRGQHVAALGYPQGLYNTFSTGIISAIVEYKGAREIQFTAPISPGSSGGALLSDRGEVIGVTTSIIEDSQNVNFAVDIRHVTALFETIGSRIGSVKTPAPSGEPAYPLKMGDEAYVGTVDDPYLDPDIVNVSKTKTVDSFTVTYMAQTAGGEFLKYGGTQDEYSEYKYTVTILPGELVNPGKVTISDYGGEFRYIYAAVTAMHTTDGTLYSVPEDEWEFTYWELD